MDNRIDLADGEEGYLIYNSKYGFVCIDEDRVSGTSYSFTIDEDTLYFSLDVARESAGIREIILREVR